MWVDLPGFKDLVLRSWNEGKFKWGSAVDCFQRNARIWNKEIFGNVFCGKPRLRARLRGIQERMVVAPSDYLIELEKELTKEY